jgi:hypothetical protein
MFLSSTPQARIILKFDLPGSTLLALELSRVCGKTVNPVLAQQVGHKSEKVYLPMCKNSEPRFPY